MARFILETDEASSRDGGEERCWIIDTEKRGKGFLVCVLPKAEAIVERDRLNAAAE